MENGAGGHTPIQIMQPQPGAAAPTLLIVQPTASARTDPDTQAAPPAPVASIPDTPTVSSPAPALPAMPPPPPAVPLVRPQPVEPNSAPTTLIVVHAPAPSGRDRPIQTLPLVDLTKAITHTPRHPAEPPPPTTRTPSHQPQPTRQPTQSLDIAQIVDTVHRKFLRRLAVESERRAVR